MKVPSKSALAEAILLMLLGFTVMSFIALLVLTNEQLRDDYVNSARSEIVKVVNFTGNWGGTAFAVKAKSGKVVLITNKHVCKDTAFDTMIVDDTYPVKVLEQSATYDLCVLTNPDNLKGLSLANSYRENQNIFVIGHPLLEPLTMTKGQISGQMLWDNSSFVIITANAFGGSSGSPILNVFKQVVGIVAGAKVGESRTVGVGLEPLKEVLERY